MEQKIKEKILKITFFFCIDCRKALAINSVQKYIFPKYSHKNKERLFSPSVFLFRFIYKPMTKQAVYLNELQFLRQSEF